MQSNIGVSVSCPELTGLVCLFRVDINFQNIRLSADNSWMTGARGVRCCVGDYGIRSLQKSKLGFIMHGLDVVVAFAENDDITLVKPGE